MDKKNLFLIIFIYLIRICHAQVSPDILFEELFHDVQTQHVFEDSKTFPDCIPLFTSEKILKDYRSQKNQDSFNLKKFVLSHFSIPQDCRTEYHSDTSLSAVEHIHNLWPFLTRKEDTIRNSSLLPLPNPYIVPGGRFREIYYWDSYFTLLGLKESGNIEMMENMVKNFNFLIHEYGFIPNGNRTYYLSRSQPPFFSVMIALLEEVKKEKNVYQYLPALEKEYTFWMQGKDSLNNIRKSYLRIVRMEDGSILNRYWDNRSSPRPESYREDVSLCSLANRNPEDLYRNIRAACESGWDFSSRWLKDKKDLATIQTTAIIPVDLNCLLYHLEISIARGYFQINNTGMGDLYLGFAQKRKVAIMKYCWNKEQRFFFDYNFKEQKITKVRSLAAAFPLFFQICSSEQARLVRKTIMKEFLKEGGLTTTLCKTDQQWDAPNGWPPLQYICVKGFLNYPDKEARNDADQIMAKWIMLNEKIFKATGKMMEKYNVEDVHLKGGGGEYPLQDGFGWTNGVFLYFFSEMK